MAFEQLRFSSTFVGISRELKMDRLHILPRMLICLLLEQKGVPQTFLLWAHSLVHKHNFCQAESHFRPQVGAAALNIFHEATALRKRTSAVHPSFRKNISLCSERTCLNPSLIESFQFMRKWYFLRPWFLLIMAVELANWNMLNVMLRRKTWISFLAVPREPSKVCHEQSCLFISYALILFSISENWCLCFGTAKLWKPSGKTERLRGKIPVTCHLNPGSL